MSGAFEIPGKEIELVEFIAALMFLCVAIAALILMPLTGTNVLIVVAILVFSLASFRHGFVSRKNRLGKKAEIERLRNGLGR